MFKPGQIVVCVISEGYALTEGKTYEVLAYEPSHYEADARFTWPAYVHVLNDNGKRVVCHDYRFKPA